MMDVFSDGQGPQDAAAHPLQREQGLDRHCKVCQRQGLSLSKILSVFAALLKLKYLLLHPKSNEQNSTFGRRASEFCDSIMALRCMKNMEGYIMQSKNASPNRLKHIIEKGTSWYIQELHRAYTQGNTQADPRG